MRFFNALLVIAAVVLGASNQVAGESLEVSSPLHRLLFEISRYQAHVLDNHRKKPGTAVAVGAAAANVANTNQGNFVDGHVTGNNNQQNWAATHQEAFAKNTGEVSATANGKKPGTAVAVGAAALNVANTNQQNVVGSVGGSNSQSNSAFTSQEAAAINYGEVEASAGSGNGGN